ncbi:uncharacterized protein LOC142340998 [Convolutriloba macropyga]|uniref:uncharacterized protein LOC142340998 n=1 Tax=Convolutriloba macropyga TaxID=536237 RepID=UPI003F52022F
MLEELPSNILSSIFDLTPMSDLVKISRLSKNFYIFVKSYAKFRVICDQQSGTIDRNFIRRFKQGENYLFVLFASEIFSAWTADLFKNTPKAIQCQLDQVGSHHMDRVTDDIKLFYIKNYCSYVDVMAHDKCDDLICCYLSDGRLVMLRQNSEKKSVEEIASNGNFLLDPIAKIQISERFTIAADKFGIMYVLSSDSLCKLNTFNQRSLRKWSPTFGLFPVSIIFSTIMNSFVVFMCDDIGSFGLWHLSTGKVDTFPGQVMHHEKTVKLMPLGNYFVRISQDQCFNLIVDLFCIDERFKIKFLGCIGFLNREINYKLKDIDLEIEPNFVLKSGRPITFKLKL